MSAHFTNKIIKITAHFNYRISWSLSFLSLVTLLLGARARFGTGCLECWSLTRQSLSAPEKGSNMLSGVEPSCVSLCGIWATVGRKQWGREWSTFCRWHHTSLIILLVVGKPARYHYIISSIISLQNDLRLLRDPWNLVLLAVRQTFPKSLPGNICSMGFHVQNLWETL